MIIYNNMEEIIILNDVNYILSDILFKKAPIYCKTCRTTRDIIKKKEIYQSNYIYARFKDNNWIITDGKSPKYDKILFTEAFMKTINEFNGLIDIKDDTYIEKAPDILDLLDNEKFKDNNGNILEIETRGERNIDNIYFKVKDVSNIFEINDLRTTIIDNRYNGYKKNIDYKIFNCNYMGGNNIITCRKILFLTYEGLLRVLFVSRNNKTKPFIKWAVETLFTCQLGTNTQKEKLVSNVLGISAKVIKEVFNCDTNTLPCVYLMTLGYVKDLRISMNIDNKYNDDCIVAKYGFTKELSRRTGEHLKIYNKINGCDLKLKHYSYIDPQYISNGENDIKDFMKALNLKLSYENYDELIIIPKEYIKIISEKYEYIGKKYAGHITELIIKIKELEDKYEKQELKHKYEIQTIIYEKEKLNNDLELQKEKYEHQLLKKDFELLKLQNKIN